MVSYSPSITQEEKILRQIGYNARLDNAGPKALIVPIGDSYYGAMSGATVEVVGSQNGQTGGTGTLSSGNWNAMTTPLRDNQLIPIWRPDGTEWIEFADAAFWNNTAGTSEPSYTWVLWVRVVAGAAVQILWAKTPNIGSSTGTDWAVYISTTEQPAVVGIDDSAGARIGRFDSTAMTETLHHLAFTKSTGIIDSAFSIYLDGVKVDSNDLTTGTYVTQEDGSTVVRIGAESDGGSPLASPLAGAHYGPLFDPGQVWSLNKIKTDFRMGRAGIATQLSL